MTEAEVKGAYELETGNVIVKRFEGLNPVHTPGAVSYTHLDVYKRQVVNPMLNKLGGEGNKGNELIQVGGSFNSVMATITPMSVSYTHLDVYKRQTLHFGRLS